MAMKRLLIVAATVAASLTFSIDGYAQWGKTDLGNAYGSRRGGGYVSGTDRGFKITGEVGAMGILGYYSGFEFNALAGCGYQFNPYFYLGGLVGGGWCECAHYHYNDYGNLSYSDDDYYYSGAFIFTSDARAYLLRGKVIPFFFARVGLEVFPDFGVCPYIGGGPAVKIMLSRKVGLTIQPSVRLGFDFECILGGSVGVEF